MNTIFSRVLLAFAAGCAVCALVALCVALQDPDSNRKAREFALQPLGPQQRYGNATVQPQPSQLSTPTEARTRVQDTVPPTFASDPCEARLHALQQQLDVEREERRMERLRAGHAASEYHVDSPFAAFLKTPEAATMSGADLAVVRDTLLMFPIELTPGEATGLLEHKQTVEGLPRPIIPNDVFITYIGAVRVKQGLTTEQLALVREDLGEDEYARLFEGK